MPNACLRYEANKIRKLARVLARVQVEDVEARLVVAILRARIASSQSMQEGGRQGMQGPSA